MVSVFLFFHFIEIYLKHVNYITQIKQIPLQKTLVLINNFVSNTVGFLNTFSETVEKKISNISNRITELEILISFMEAKLHSIPGLEDRKEEPLSSPAVGITS